MWKNTADIKVLREKRYECNTWANKTRILYEPNKNKTPL